ncbi:hypothetical protein CUZ56_01749 [Saezia sanguinis]|uniref:Uncharacterized protein n=1 Tax=Saezia sanguinis TaxID=1965230 RepID=A0A433SCL6_9BURK|nr:hypothetical protein CUZ56_01749 [Saezia sanguinis]
MPYYTAVIEGPSGGNSRYYYRYQVHSHQMAVAFGRAARQAYADTHHVAFGDTHERPGSFQSGVNHFPGDGHELDEI